MVIVHRRRPPLPPVRARCPGVAVGWRDWEQGRAIYTYNLACVGTGAIVSCFRCVVTASLSLSDFPDLPYYLPPAPPTLQTSHRPEHIHKRRERESAHSTRVNLNALFQLRAASVYSRTPWVHLDALAIVFACSHVLYRGCAGLVRFVDGFDPHPAAVFAISARNAQITSCKLYEPRAHCHTSTYDTCSPDTACVTGPRAGCRSAVEPPPPGLSTRPRRSNSCDGGAVGHRRGRGAGDEPVDLAV